MLSGEILMDLAKHIQTGLELTEERLLSQVQEAEQTQDTETPADNLSGRSKLFASEVAKLFREKNISEQALASRIGCLAEDIAGLRQRGASRPSRDLVTALCLALHLPPKQAQDLFHSAGYTLVDYEVSDIVLMYCLEKNIFDLEDVNSALECFNIKSISRQAIVQELDRRVWNRPRQVH